MQNQTVAPQPWQKVWPFAPHPQQERMDANAAFPSEYHPTNRPQRCEERETKC